MTWKSFEAVPGINRIESALGPVELEPGQSRVYDPELSALVGTSELDAFAGRVEAAPARVVVRG